MAKQTTRKFSDILKSKKQVFDSLKGNETRQDSGGNLPDGIEAGIAELASLYIGEYKSGPFQGEPYFRAAGIVKQPKIHNGIPIEGLQTSIMEPLCDTPQSQGKRKTFSDHLDYALNELRKLGVETAKLDTSDLDSVISELLENPPHFRFRTWKGQATAQFPNPRTNEVWMGAVDYEDEETDDIIEDKDEDEDDDEETEADDDDDEEEETKADDDEEEIEPEKGDIYGYKPPHSKKVLQCKVTAVNKAKQTTSLRNLDNNKLYKDVPWDDLVDED